MSGYPKPELYNQHYINKYSFPKGLIAMRKPEEVKKRNERVSLYDLEQPAIRKGISGWKLTKRPMAPEGMEQLFIGGNLNGGSYEYVEPIDEIYKPRKTTQKARTGRVQDGGELIDGRKIQVGGANFHDHPHDGDMP